MPLPPGLSTVTGPRGTCLIQCRNSVLAMPPPWVLTPASIFRMGLWAAPTLPILWCRPAVPLPLLRSAGVCGARGPATAGIRSRPSAAKVASLMSALSITQILSLASISISPARPRRRCVCSTRRTIGLPPRLMLLPLPMGQIPPLSKPTPTLPLAAVATPWSAPTSTRPLVRTGTTTWSWISPAFLVWTTIPTLAFASSMPRRGTTVWPSTAAPTTTRPATAGSIT